MARFGIGVITYNRLPYLRALIERIRRHTKAEHALVVADDGSSDGTRDWCVKEGLTLLGTTNRGVCWNKNRALFALEALGCDPIILMEDDCYPDTDGWEEEWRVATALFGHVSFAHPKLARWQISGTGTATDPIVNNKSTAQCASVSGGALRAVGFFDTRFKGYGVGHAEYTTRMKRAGHGFKFAVVEGGARARANLYVKGGIVANDAPTFKDPGNIKRNEDLFDQLKGEPVYRHPWRGEEERAAFEADMAVGGLSTAAYAAAFLTDAPSGEADLAGLLYPVPARRALTALLRDADSARDGWFASVASGVPVQDGELTLGFNRPVNGLLRERAARSWRVIEFGAGHSTTGWAGRVAAVFSVDADAARVALAARLAGPNATLRLAPSEAAMAEAAGEAEGPFQLASFPGVFRPPFLRAALERLAPDGVVVIAGSDRTEVSPGRVALTTAGFRELRLGGLVPGTWRRDNASIFYRAANALGL